MRRIIIILLVITVAAAAVDARRRVILSPKNVLFVGFDSSSKNNTDKIRKINTLFLTKIRKMAGEK